MDLDRALSFLKILSRGLFKAGLEEASQQWKNTPSTERIADHPAVFVPLVNAADLLP